MPSKSKAQQMMMAIAEHNPDELYPENKNVLAMGMKKIHDFAKTKRSDLPKRKKKRTNALASLMNGDAAVAKKISKGGK